MIEALERCKRLLQGVLTNNKAPSEKRIRACTELEILSRRRVGAEVSKPRN